MGKHLYSRAAETLLKYTYVDDIIDSFPDEKTAEKIVRDIDTVIKMGGFAVKEWLISTNKEEYKEDTAVTKILLHDEHKVLGMIWERSTDVISYRVKVGHINLNSSDSVEISQKYNKKNSTITN